MLVAEMWLSTLQRQFQEGTAGLAVGCTASTRWVPLPCSKPSLAHNHARPSAKQVNMNQSMFVPSQ